MPDAILFVVDRVMRRYTEPYLLTTPTDHKGSCCREEKTMADAKQERTFIMLKPDAVHRGLIADIIKRFEQKGFKLVALKFMIVCSHFV